MRWLLLLLLLLLAGQAIMGQNYTHRIQVIGTDGTPGFAFGTYGAGDGQFNFVVNNAASYGYVPPIYFGGPMPSGYSMSVGSAPQIAADNAGNIYVCDTGNKRIQVFDAPGNFLRRWDTGTTYSFSGVAVSGDVVATYLRGYGARFYSTTGVLQHQVAPLNGDSFVFCCADTSGDFWFLGVKGTLGAGGTDKSLALYRYTAAGVLVSRQYIPVTWGYTQTVRILGLANAGGTLYFATWGQGDTAGLIYRATGGAVSTSPYTPGLISGLAADASGLYLSAFNSALWLLIDGNLIYKLSPAGATLATFGPRGSELGQFARKNTASSNPLGAMPSLSRNGFLYVIDATWIPTPITISAPVDGLFGFQLFAIGDDGRGLYRRKRLGPGFMLTPPVTVEDSGAVEPEVIINPDRSLTLRDDITITKTSRDYGKTWS